MTLEQAIRSREEIWSAADDVSRMSQYELRMLAWKADARVTEIQRRGSQNAR